MSVRKKRLPPVRSSRITIPSAEVRRIDNTPIPETSISADGRPVVDAPRMCTVATAPSVVVDVVSANGAEELPSDAVAIGRDVSWDEH